MSTFYQHFERHDHGKGLKGQSTHYCPGCGHGLAHKYLADAIDELNIQDRTVAISPVGCSVFLYYYLDVGNSQAAHGRAPAVALGQKVANPNSVVIAYQGDGDLASIGLAEIMQAAQLGIPLTVIFINNAIYGMTGGQLAPTTLMGQKTATSPTGRDKFMGEPLKVAELIAQIDGPVYVERVALFDAKQRVKAQKAIKKAVQCQVENRGFAFVEVLAECPTHLHVTPNEAAQWVKEKMLPVYPLGVKKDLPITNWGEWRKPTFEPEAIMKAIGALGEPARRFTQRFPSQAFGQDVGFKFAGSGGDGAQTVAMLLALAAINEGYDATHIPSYGPESRGGTSYADVRLAENEVFSPAAPTPHAMVAFNTPSLVKFGPQVLPGGVIIYDRSVIHDVPKIDSSIQVIGVPCSEIAKELGRVVVKNIVALGALAAATHLFPDETYLTAVREALADKAKLIPLNEQAFARGTAAARSA